MKRSTAFLFAALTLMTGMVLGFLFSPVKGGIGNNCGNNNGNTTNHTESRVTPDEGD